MAYLGEGINEYGTAVSRFVCDTCGEEFTVCPAVTEEAWGGSCLAEGCGSYDLRRDIDLLWDHVEIVRAGQ